MGKFLFQRLVTHSDVDQRNAPPLTFGNVRDERIRAALEVLRSADLAKDISIDNIATAVNLSPSRFRHLFTQEVGETPHGCIRLLRMLRAQKLLEQSFYRIKEIMVMVGYCDASHFGRDYKRCFSVSPSLTRQISLLQKHSPSQPKHPTNSHFRQ
jgi:transcriptional regulator GlxA family with amidase domain